MGAKTSKLPKAEREQNKAEIIQEQRAKIEKVFVAAATNSSVVTTDHIKFAAIAIDQIERGDKPFTKADYIMILARLKDKNANIQRMKEIYSTFTNGELITAIRAIIYDVEDTEAPDSSLVEAAETKVPETQLAIKKSPEIQLTVKKSPRARPETQLVVKKAPETQLVTGKNRLKSLY